MKRGTRYKPTDEPRYMVWAIKVRNRDNRVIMPAAFFGQDVTTTVITRDEAIEQARVNGWTLDRVETRDNENTYLHMRKRQNG